MPIPLKQPDLFRQQVFINQQWQSAHDGSTFAITNPATGEKLASVPNCGQIETDQAIHAAEQALPCWQALTAKQRSLTLLAWYRLIVENTEDLAQLITAECGKPLAEARGEVAYGASFVEWFAEEAKRAYGETIPSPSSATRIQVIKQAIGVCAAITPWNFPLAMITRKVAPALAAGCTVITKPAEQTPLTALALAALGEEAGIPAGVFNVITGDPVAIGATLTASPVVRKLSFTGSTEIGRLLMAQSASTLKKLSLELGGNAPFIVFDDANLDAAVEGAILAKYRNTGQTCVCANRFLVQDGIYDAFAQALAERVARLKVGNGVEDGVQQGPLIDAAALAKVEQHVADALTHGATAITGGQRLKASGHFFQPTVLTNMAANMRIAKEETFGPVAALFRFETEAEAVQMANDTEYGLASYFYSQDISRCFRVAEALEYGMVGVNTGFISNEVSPFGGIKQSGLGREGSRHGLDEYLELKYLCFGVV